MQQRGDDQCHEVLADSTQNMRQSQSENLVCVGHSLIIIGQL